MPSQTAVARMMYLREGVIETITLSPSRSQGAKSSVRTSGGGVGREVLAVAKNRECWALLVGIVAALQLGGILRDRKLVSKTRGQHTGA